MRKMKLGLDALEVETFETTAARRAARGTVRGHAGTVLIADGGDREAGPEVPASNDISCDTCQTCDDSQCDSCWFNTCSCHVYCVGEA